MRHIGYKLGFHSFTLELLFDRKGNALIDAVQVLTVLLKVKEHFVRINLVVCISLCYSLSSGAKPVKVESRVAYACKDNNSLYDEEKRRSGVIAVNHYDYKVYKQYRRRNQHCTPHIRYLQYYFSAENKYPAYQRAPPEAAELKLHRHAHCVNHKYRKSCRSHNRCSRQT